MDLKQGDHVLMEHGMMRNTYVVALVTEKPTKSTVMVRYYRRAVFDQLARTLNMEDSPTRRNRKSILHVLPEGIDYALRAEQVVARCEAHFQAELAACKQLRSDIAELALKEHL